MLETRMKALMIAGMAGHARAHNMLLSLCAERLKQYFSRRLSDRVADVEDLVQETLIAIHQRRESYNPGLPFTAWLHAIAHYKLVDHFRRSRLRATLPIDDFFDLAVNDESTAINAAADIDKLLKSLPLKQQEAIRLTRLTGLTVPEAAAATGQSESGIKVGVHRGLKQLMATIKGSER